MLIAAASASINIGTFAPKDDTFDDALFAGYRTLIDGHSSHHADIIIDVNTQEMGVSNRWEGGGADKENGDAPPLRAMMNLTDVAAYDSVVPNKGGLSHKIYIYDGANILYSADLRTVAEWR